MLLLAPETEQRSTWVRSGSSFSWTRSTASKLLKEDPQGLEMWVYSESRMIELEKLVFNLSGSSPF